MKKVLILCTMASLMLLSSCKKDKEIGQSNPVETLKAKNNAINSNESSSQRIAPRLFYKASDAFLSQSATTFTHKYIDNLNRNTGISRPGPYSNFDASDAVVAQVWFNGGCGTGTVDVIYQVTTIEKYGYTYSLLYSWMLSAIGNYSPTTSYQYSQEVINQTSTYYCATPIVERIFYVTVNIPTNEYEFLSSATLLTTGTSSGTAVPPVTIYQDVSFTIPYQFYTGGPARIYPSPSQGNLSVYTDCSLICYSSHTICPLSGVFKYRLLGSTGPWITVNFNPSGAFLSMSAGTYEYTCTLTYTFGNSQPNIGTFVIP
jgi:hypothetical protein